jgi:hypothetical protein
MSTSDFELVPPPADDRQRELWLQHAAGFILFEDVRQYARERLGAELDATARAAAMRAIDDTLYGLMMVIDGVTGDLANPEMRVQMKVGVELVSRNADEEETLQYIDFQNGDGMCMGYHGWMEGDFGRNPIAKARRQE